MNDITKRTWAEIYPGNILHNYKALRARVPEGTRFLGVVKANAYGHGAVPVAKLLEGAGADYLAVACLDEAIELRNAGISLPILILGHTPAEYTAELINYGITQSVGSLEAAKDFSAKASAMGKNLKVHIKLDTGMSRLGFVCDDKHFADTVSKVSLAVKLPGFDVEGVFTHFAVSDEPDDEESIRYTREQFRRFISTIEAVEKTAGMKFTIRHCANTGATLYFTEFALDMIRPGLLLYGYGDEKNLIGLKPCMALKTRIYAVKEYDEGTTVSYGRKFTAQRKTRMGVIPVGYADGLFRITSNQLSYYTKFGPAPQRGRICMDMCMIDITDLPEAGVDTEVEIFGLNNPIAPYSEAAGTIPYELVCAVSKRVPRVYVE